MNTLRIWDQIGDLLGQTPFHPQYFILKAEALAASITYGQIRGNVLDIGCGRQKLKNTIEKKGLSYTSLDHPTIYKRQRSTILPDILADIESTPLPDNSFDSVLLLMVLAHLPDPEKGLKEIYRILKKGGKVFISTVENYPAHDLPDDYFRYRLLGIISLCKKAGFKVSDSNSWGNIWQVTAVNFNTFVFQTIKIAWENTKFLPILILLLIFLYPLTVISNFLAVILTPLDLIKTSKLINFVIAKK